MLDKVILARIHDIIITMQVRNKIHKIHNHIAPKLFNQSIKQVYRNYWKSLQLYPSVKWAEVYEQISGIESMYYVPEDIYYVIIERIMNYKPMAKSENCKSRYYVNFPHFNFPKVLMKNENGVMYDEENRVIPQLQFNDFLNGISKTGLSVIIKPILDSGGGRKVEKFSLDNGCWFSENGNRLSLEFLVKTYNNKDYILQSYVEQHEFLAQFNASSTNTFRLFTYRSIKDESINVLHSILRIGRKGSITDNQASGGYSIGINQEGKLNGFAIDKTGDIYSKVNTTTLNGCLIVPWYTDICEQAKKLAKEFKYSRLLGLDITIDKHGQVFFIEINNTCNEINFFQMNNGPLFGEYTDEIKEFCKGQKKAYCFDFSVKLN